MFSNPTEKMKLLNSKSVLGLLRVTPDRYCHLLPLAASDARFPFSFFACESPAELENIRNQSDFNLISYSFA